MSHDWYDKQNVPATGAALDSETIRDEFALIESAMNNLPTFTGNGGKIVISNSAGTALITTTSMASSQTTNNAFGIVADSLTTGSILSLTSNSADTSSRILLNITNDNAAAVGATLASFKQDSTGINLFLDQDGNGIALSIDTEATTASGVVVAADALTTGSGLSVTSNSASSSSRSLVNIDNQNSSATGTVAMNLVQAAVAGGICLKITNASGVGGIQIDQTGSGSAIVVNKTGSGGGGININANSITTGHLIDTSATSLTTGNGLKMDTFDALTTGSIISLKSNSSDTGVRNLLEIENNNSAATSARLINLVQAANNEAIFLSASGVTTSSVVQIAATALTSGTLLNLSTVNALTTGSIAFFESGSSDTSARKLVRIKNNDVAAVLATALSVEQDSSATAISIEQNGDGTALDVVAAVTTSSIVVIRANSLTTGIALSVTSDSSSTGTRNLVSIVNDNTAATGAVALHVQQDSTAKALIVDQNGNGTGIEIDTEATTASALVINPNTLTTGSAISIVGANALTTSNLIDISSDSASTSGRNLVRIIQENSAASGAVGIFVRQDSIAAAIRIQATSTGIGLAIDHNGNGQALNIDTEATSASAIQINATVMTTGNVINCTDANALTTGSVLSLESNSASTSTRNIVLIRQSNASASSARALRVEQTSTNTCLFLDQNGNGTALTIDTEATTANGILVAATVMTSGDCISISDANALTTGSILDLRSNSASTSSRNLVNVVNDNTAAVNSVCVRLQQDAASPIMILDHNATAAGSSYIDFQGTAAANTTGPISTLTTSGATTHHIQHEVNGVKGWIPFSTNNPS